MIFKKSETIESLSRYLEYVRELRRNWRIPNHKELWFRAEDEKHFKTRLQPSLYRPNAAGKRKRIKKLLLVENDLYEDFRRVCGTQLGEIKLEDEWDPYFLMQHHGVPTRLLDWSDGALIALHFAVRDKSEPFKTGSIIYVLDPWWLLRVLDKHPDRKEAVKRWDKYNKAHPHDSFEDDWDLLYLPIEKEELKDPLLATPETPLLWDSPHVSRRVAAQRSRFMIFGTDPEWISKLASDGSSRIVSLYIPTDAIADLKETLRDAGITESVVYPDLDGLGRELRQVWEIRTRS